MFENLITKIKSVLSDNEINTYNEYFDVDLSKNYNKSIGFLSIREIEKVGSSYNMRDEKSCEVFVTVECKLIAKKGVTANVFSQTINNVYMDFLLSRDIPPISLKMDNMKINSLYSRFEANLTFKFRYFLSETDEST